MANQRTDFVIVNPDFAYRRLPALLRDVAGFAASPEWAELEENELDDLPGIVLSRFHKFLLRLLKDEPAGDALLAGLEFVERLAASGDAELRNAVVHEMYEALESHAAETRAFFDGLGPASRELYLEHFLEP